MRAAPKFLIVAAVQAMHMRADRPAGCNADEDIEHLAISVADEYGLSVDEVLQAYRQDVADRTAEPSLEPSDEDA